MMPFKRIAFVTGTLSSFAVMVSPGIAVDNGQYQQVDCTQTYKNFIVSETPPDDTDRLSTRERRSSPIQLKDPPNISTQTEYDYQTGSYEQVTKVGDNEISRPQKIDAQYFDSSQNNSEMREYWRQQLRTRSADNSSQSGLEKYLNPRIKVDVQGFDRVFGTNVIDIRPQGNVTVTVGTDISKIDNFTLPKKQRNDVSFDFDMAMQVGVTGTIGDKMKVGINYNTEATFEFENEQKIEYVGYDDEIIQRIEFGNVSMPLEGTLIQGSTTLFGVKTDLKFGKLTASAVLSQQKGETKSIEVNAGSVSNEFEIAASDYEANRHFFLNHYFRDNYETALANLPIVSSGINITNIEVWVTNDNMSTTDTRNSLAFIDLADDPKKAYNSIIHDNSSRKSNLPDNERNNLYGLLTGSYQSIRDINSAASTLNGHFSPGTDYEKIGNARKLSASEYTFNANLGFISLNTTLKDDQVLAVAYEYTYKGKTYKVGEFSTDVPTTKALILKLIKGTSFSPALPNWKLMMKNVYSLNSYRVSADDFQLQIKYKNDKTGTAVNYISAGDIDGKMLLKVLNLDNANSQLEATPDGQFDYIEGVTINSEKGRIYLPVLEPFGSYLQKKINDKAAADKYCYTSLYDSTKTIAKQNAERDKFIITGKYKSSGGSEISLDAMNIPQGSVIVTCGGLKLTEGTDFVVDYLLGTVTIVNESILNSGNKINVTVESNSGLNSTTKVLMGAHFNYAFNKDFNVGATIMRLSEKTTTNKVNIGDEPIKNTIWGLDARYAAPVPYLTRLIDKIPLISTKAESKFSVEGEFAQLIPGHSKSIDKAGTCYIDDFESAQSSIDIKSLTSWVMSSTPAGTKRFPEAELNNDLRYGYNRAKLAWYNVLSDFQGTGTSGSGITPSYISKDDQSNHYVRAVYEKELFPKAQSVSGVSTQLTILNLAYYPQERGPYNFDVEGETGISAGIDKDGNLKNPSSRWAGIMRELTTTDFEASNVEFIEFWVMDPFIYETEGMGGDLYFNLGNVSEDVLKDSRKSFENGIPYPSDPTYLDTTAFGVVSNKTFLVNAFDNTNGAKEYQDLGFDGLNDNDERTFFSNYLERIAAAYGTSSQAYANAYNDASGDNYHFFRGSDYDSQKLSILERYKNYNGSQGNSCDVSSGGEDYSTIKDRYPDVEDINLDNTLNETESYYQYKVHLSPDEMEVGKNYISDIVESNVKTVNGETQNVKWYQFKVPIYEPDSTVGSISDYKSIRFLRMYLTGFQKECILRFAELNLVRGDWRKYNYALSSAGEVTTEKQIDDGVLDLSTVSLEENGSKTPVNYLLPPGIERERDYQTNQVVEQDEQSLSMNVKNLPDGQAVAAYKTAIMDLRQYKKLKMFVHAEQMPSNVLHDNDLSIFIRLGSDYKENYYEYEIPLSVTPDGYYADDDNGRLAVWPEQNNVEIVFEKLQLVKQQRNSAARESGTTVSTSLPYTVDSYNNSRITIIGSPNISNIKTIMIGVRNRSQEDNILDDDGISKSAQIWVNELRLTDFNEDGGWAAKAKATLQLADFAELSVAGYTHTPGFGSIEKKVSERYQETVYQYDLTALMQMGKFFNNDYGVKMPLYFGFSENYEIPKYNPLDPDIELETTLSDPTLTKAEKDEIKDRSISYERRKSVNLTNVHIEGRSSEAKQEAKSQKAEANGEKLPNVDVSQGQKPFYHVSNFTANFAYTEYYAHNIDIKSQLEKTLSTSLEYNYTYSPKNYKPFSKTAFLRSNYFALIRDVNFYLLPTMLSATAQINREYSAVNYRSVDANDVATDPVFRKDFLWNRTYAFRYKFTNNLSLDFSANNQSRVNTDGLIDNYTADKVREERDTIYMKFFDLGYNTHYDHTMKFTWNTPINKIPGLGWTSLNAIYNAEYQWDRGVDPIEVAATDTTEAYTIDYGNTINNTGILTLNGQLNFERVYRKVPYLKGVMSRFTQNGRKTENKQKREVNYSRQGIKITANSPRLIAHNLGTEDADLTVTDADGKPVKGEVEIVDKNRIRFTSSENVNAANVSVTGYKPVGDNLFVVASDYMLFSLMSIRNVSMTYKNQRSNTLPGYIPGTKIIGMEQFNALTAPGWDYITALNGENFHELAAQRSWLVKDSTLNSPVLYTKGNSFSFRVAVEPINTLKIDVSFDRSILYNTENYYVYSADYDGWQTNSIVKTGNYRISYNMLATSFKKLNDDFSLETYDKFLENRKIIAERLAAKRSGLNGYNPAPQTDDEGNLIYGDYPDGYSATSQEVMLPAFLAAYAGRSADKISTDPFLKFPLPNWKISYKGLANLPFLKDYVRSALLTHAYASTYSVRSFKNNANYSFDDEAKYGLNFVRYENTNLFIPQYEISSATIEEKFAPLFGLDISWNNMLSTKLEYRRTRQMTLGFANSQITELYHTEWVIGLGYKFAQLPVSIKTKSSGYHFKSDLDLRSDFVIDNDKTILREIEDLYNEISAGQRSYSIKTTADYQLSKRFKVQLYYNHQITNPLISTSYRTVNIKFGFSLTMSLD